MKERSAQTVDKASGDNLATDNLSRRGANRNRQLKVLYRIGDLVNSTVNTATLLRRIVRETADAFEGSGALVAFETLPAAGLVKVEALQGISDESLHAEGLLPEGHMATLAVRRKAFVSAENCNASAEAEMAAPLEKEGDPLGVLYVRGQDTKPFSEEDERLLQAIAAQASRIIHTSRNHDRAVRQTERLESLFDVGQNLISTDPLPEVLNRVTQSLLTIVDVKQCTVLLVGKGHDLQLSASSGGAGHYTQRRDATDSLVEKLSARGEPVRVLDVKKTVGRRPGKMPKKERQTTLLAVPIFYRQRLVGILNIYTADTQHFEPEEMRLFKAYASLCGVAIENARQHERLLAVAEEIRVAERANTLQALAGEISHRVRNPLTASHLLLDALRDEGAFPPGHGADYEVLIESLQKIDHTVSRIQELAARRAPQFEWLDMNRIVDDVVALCQHRLASRQIKIHKRFTADLPRVLADVGEIEQVIYQAITNAMDAMRHGSILNLSTMLVAGPDDKGGIPMVRINVRDTGSGVGADVTDGLFDPFAREPGSRAGLGLFVAEKLVRKYGGRLTVRNASDHGTSVSLTMPALENHH